MLATLSISTLGYYRFVFIFTTLKYINKTMTTQAAIKITKTEAVKKRKIFKLLEFIAEQNLYGSEDGSVDEDTLDENPHPNKKPVTVTPSVEKPMTIVHVETISDSDRGPNKSLEAKNSDKSAEDSIVIEDDDEVETIDPLPNNNSQKEARTPSFHYGMAIAKEVFDLSGDLKVDAKIEIMQIIGKYQKRQLYETERDASEN